ncbi:ABC transporter permease subunit [Clostridium senegalense]
MINCIKNEIIKLIHNKKLYIFLLALVLLIVFKLIYMYSSSFGKTPIEQLKKKESVLIELKAEAKSESLSKEKKKDIDIQMKKLDEEIKMLKDNIANPDKNWKNTIKNKIENLENEKGELSENLDSIEIEKCNAELQYYNYLLDNDIEPNKEYKIYGFEDITGIFDFINKMILPILIAFLCSDIIASEYTFSTIKALLTKPVSRRKIFCSKFLSNICIVTVTICLMEFITFIIIGLVFNLGNPSYPIIVGTKYVKASNNNLYINNISAVIGSSYIISAWKLILLNLFMQFIFIITCVSFVMFISTIFTNNITSLTINLGILMFISLITYILPLKFLNKLYPILFTTYSCGTDVIKGNLVMRLNSTIINIPLGIVIMLIWSIVCYFISSKIFNKRDVLI